MKGKHLSDRVPAYLHPLRPKLRFLVDQNKIRTCIGLISLQSSTAEARYAILPSSGRADYIGLASLMTGEDILFENIDFVILWLDAMSI